MQNEDDLRGLAKVMDFMRAISILFVVINIYWFCYQSFREWGINIVSDCSTTSCVFDFLLRCTPL